MDQRQSSQSTFIQRGRDELLVDRPTCDANQRLSLRDKFHHLASTFAHLMGSAWAFFIAVLVIAIWGISGPLFRFSDTWQLVINTATTIVTFLMVFLIQNTQNRDARALHLKLDELLRAITMARTDLVDLENLSEAELDKLEEEFHALKNREERKKVNNTRGSQSGRNDKAKA